jgi:hypothetical protein
MILVTGIFSRRVLGTDATAPVTSERFFCTNNQTTTTSSRLLVLATSLINIGASKLGVSSEGLYPTLLIMSFFSACHVYGKISFTICGNSRAFAFNGNGCYHNSLTIFGIMDRTRLTFLDCAKPAKEKIKKIRERHKLFEFFLGEVFFKLHFGCLVTSIKAVFFFINNELIVEEILL